MLPNIMKNIDSSDRRRMFTIIFLLIISVIFLFLLKYKFISDNEEVNIDGIFNHDIQTDDIDIFAEDLNIPWDIVFLPDNEALVTERPGNLIRIGIDKKSIRVKGVTSIEEGGLLGLALHPNFKNNSWIYIYLTSEVNGKIENRVERYKLDLENNTLKEKLTLISGIPAASYHDGGRIMFGPDNFLYITTGDATESYLSQDINSTGGKILRVDENGKTPRDNPFKNKVFSYGHRNPQGLAWDDNNRLWATEHGRSGVKSGLDELNLIVKGKNYGWPAIEGDDAMKGMEKPVINSGEYKTWAPAGMIYLNGTLYFTGLEGETIYSYNIEKKQLNTYLQGQFGRLRAITYHNGFIYVSTSNRDGRGEIKEGDDKILKINPRLLQ